MPIERSFVEYHKSIANEINSTKDRIRHLIGSSHWLTDGEWKEAVLRKALENFLPESYRVGRGFVCFLEDELEQDESGQQQLEGVLPEKEKTSGQLDILVTDKNRPSLFKDGDLVFVTADAVAAVIEVKTMQSFVSKKENVIKSFIKRIRNIRQAQRAPTARGMNLGISHEKHIGGQNLWAGLFIYDTDDYKLPGSLKSEILRLLALHTHDSELDVINCISIGTKAFVRFWERGGIVDSPVHDDTVWHLYKFDGQLDGLSQAYFMSNLSFFLNKTITIDTQPFWFPIEKGKERYRELYISPGDAEAQQF